MAFRLARYDLTQESLELIAVPDNTYRDFIGGSGLAAALLFKALRIDLDPLDADSPLLLATGPLTGTKGPSVGRFVLCGKSPATGLWGESNIGGFAGPELRSAGFDGLWITGKASSPVYLWISDGQMQLKSAAHLWGVSDTYETQARIRDELQQGSVRVMSIGLAGENLLPYSIVLSDHGRIAGRTGMGALMGSKKLKAIAIRGSLPLPIVDTDGFSSLRTRVNRELRIDLVSEGLRDFGTASASDVFDYFGMMPKKYFSRGSLEGSEKVSGPTLSETLLSGVSTCHGCVIACGRKIKLDDGVERKGPEYETTMGFGPNLGVTDLEAITLLGERCDQLGLDTISFSNTLGMVTALFQSGLIDEADTDGQSFIWGDTQSIFELIEVTARREGFGAMLAMGAGNLARELGQPEYAAQVKGLELPYHDPRGASGVGLVYATSPRGACHNQSHYYLVEIGQTMESIGIHLLPRQESEEKPIYVARHQDWTSVLNSLVQCILANVPVEDTIELINHATGWDYSVQDALQAGERIWNLKRMLNGHLGASVQDDRLPDLLMQPLEDGGAAGYVPPIDEMLSEYYAVRGWDRRTGIPDDPTIKRLGLDPYAATRDRKDGD